MIGQNYNPLMTCIIVKKRGNARFFAKPNLNSNQLINPPCGSVIDTVVTRPEWFDFYLISQHSTQGTTNPTHYNVIHDTMNLKAEHYQKLSYKLTHMYYNWPVSICSLMLVCRRFKIFYYIKNTGNYSCAFYMSVCSQASLFSWSIIT